MRKTITIDGKEYAFEPIKLGPGRKQMFKASEDDAGITMVALSMQAAGHTDATVEWLDANLPAYVPSDVPGKPQASLVVLIEMAYEVNGFKMGTPGENQPVGPAE